MLVVVSCCTDCYGLLLRCVCSCSQLLWTDVCTCAGCKFADKTPKGYVGLMQPRKKKQIKARHQKHVLKKKTLGSTMFLDIALCAHVKVVVAFSIVNLFFGHDSAPWVWIWTNNWKSSFRWTSRTFLGLQGPLRPQKAQVRDWFVWANMSNRKKFEYERLRRNATNDQKIKNTKHKESLQEHDGRERKRIEIYSKPSFVPVL